MDWKRISVASLKAGLIAAVIGAVFFYFTQKGVINEVVTSSLITGAATAVLTFAISSLIANKRQA